MVMGKREAGVSWKIGREIIEEVEEFKYLGVWLDRKLRGNIHLRWQKRLNSGLRGCHG